MGSFRITHGPCTQNMAFLLQLDPCTIVEQRSANPKRTPRLKLGKSQKDQSYFFFNLHFSWLGYSHQSNFTLDVKEHSINHVTEFSNKWLPEQWGFQ